MKALRRAIDRVRDEIDDSAGHLTDRIGRTLLLLLAVAFSTGSLVAAIGVSASASSQIRADIAAAVLNKVSISAAGDAGASDTRLFQEGSAEAVCRLELVTACGLRIEIDASLARVSTLAGQATSVVTIAAQSGYLSADEIVASDGSQLLDAQDPFDVALVGPEAAEALGIPPTATVTDGYQINVAGRPVEVVGLISSEADTRAYSNVVVIPYAMGLEVAGGDGSAQLLVATEPGGGGPVAAVAREAARPDRPEILQVTRVATMQEVRTGVDVQLTRLATAVSVVLIVLTTLVIGNALLTSVVARTVEIGVRRALGGTRASVARLLVNEGVLLGFLGGMAGAGAGMCVTLVVSALNDWDFSPPLVAFVAPAVGVLSGAIASAVPAVIAMRIQPSLAMRWD
ncbi:ABC transporter permease [Promicromonospora sp. Populi]|uniref:ABC transporter permease n=1 Tax=Promicromonospora sp. Populi TaxID=3239420 RepID=UPI0034E28322